MTSHDKQSHDKQSREVKSRAEASIPRAAPPAEPPADSGKVFVIGVSGASGACYAIRVLEQLLLGGHTVHLVVSEYGQRLLFDEGGIRRVELAALCPNLAAAPGAEVYDSRVIKHPNKDVGAVIASGSFLHDGMAVVPCSSTSLGAIATGAGSNLLSRAAMVTLKERRPLIVCHREMPLNYIDIENMRTLALAGATLCSPNPGFYLLPQSVHDIVDFTAGKVLDLLHVSHDLKTRWADREDT
ncbi:MAG: UbiX family flavin prenyltransferase [Planctomycetota bacterium]